MMRTALTLTLAVTTTAVLAAGCSSGASTNTSDSGASGSTAAATTTTDPTTDAREQTLAAVQRYFQTLSRLDADPTMPLPAADQVAAGDTLTIVQADVTKRRAEGVTITGEIRVVDSKVTEVRLTPAPATTVAKVCLDTTSRAAHLPDGTPAGGGGSARAGTTLTLTNPTWPDASGWRVVGDTYKQQRQAEVCDG
ncbi:hypothetical protein [Nocardia sp. IFM 10818]